MQQSTQNNVVVVKTDGYDYEGTAAGNYFIKFSIQQLY